MRHSLTICVVTGREDSWVDWILASVVRQIRRCEYPMIRVVVVSTCDRLMTVNHPNGMRVEVVRPKPTIWQGEFRVVEEDWWAASNARNTGLCLADTEWIAFLDDRCVLGPHWLESIREAMRGDYGVFGAYEKRHRMGVKEGVIVEPGVVTGVDGRLQWMESQGMPLDVPIRMFPEWGYGCTLALPLEWALTVGGFEQAMDGLGFEDVIFGLMLGNHGYPLVYDPRMKIIEDRTPTSEGASAGCGKVYRKEDKGVSPQDKSHRALELFGTAWQTTNRAQLWQSRAAVLAHLAVGGGGRGEFPVLLDSRTDWWDGEVIGTDYMKTRAD